MTYAPGSRVQIRGEEWLVRDARPVQNNVFALRVTGLSETVRDYEATFLDSLDSVKVLSPEDVTFVRDDSQGYRRSRLFLHALLARTPLTEPGVTTRGQAAMEDSEYQYIPAQRALSLVRPRLLIADGVGLGKTIEAGILLAELIRRGRARRVLVVAMRSTLEQIQKELWSRFTIPLMRLDSVGIARIRRDIPRNKNPFHYYDKVIISIDTLKNDEQYRRYLEACHWDVVWMDECHNAANASTERNQLANLLANHTHSLILTSATPHNGNPESFASLMRMLDPTSVADAETLRKEDIEHMVVRRFKSDVLLQTPGFQQAHDDKITCLTTGLEDGVFGALAETVTHDLGGSVARADRLFSVTLLKSFLSSPEALRETLRHRMGTLARKVEDSRATENVLNAWSTDLDQLGELVARLNTLSIRETAKYQELKKLLQAWKCTGKPKSPRVVLFSERIETLRALQTALQEDLQCPDGAIREFTARLADTEQEAIVREFNEEDSPIRLLLASDVASEGVNLHHHCHHMIHYDIPWSFIRLQQRNGRIDRFGQMETPEIRYLAMVSEAHPADTRIVDKLVEKARSIEQNLGDPASALKLFTPEEEEAYLEQGVAEGRSVTELIPDWSVDFSDLLVPKTKAERILSLDVPRLYDDWLSLARDLQGELAEERARYRARTGFDDERRKQERIEVDAALKTVTITGVEDLRARLRSLPASVLQRGQVRLTTDIQRVLRHIQSATNRGDWSAEDLLWDVHPVADWMLDRAAGFFSAQEAPDIALPGLRVGERHYLIQALLTTKSGYPAYAEWLVVTDDGQRLSVRPFVGKTDSLVSVPWVNAGSAVAASRDERIAAALSAANAYARKRAATHLADLRSRVETELARVESWYARALDSSRKHSESVTPPAQCTRLQRQRANSEETYRRTKRSLEDLLSIEEQPILRVGARFTGLEEGRP